MNDASRYCIDTCIVIDLFLRYPPEVFESLAARLQDEVQEEVLRSIAPVLDELKQGQKHTEAEILDLVKVPLHEFFMPFDQEATNELPNLTRGASAYRRKRPTKKNADPYLVAWCRAHGHTLMTNDEALTTVARQDGVRVITFVEYVRNRGWTF